MCHPASPFDVLVRRALALAEASRGRAILGIAGPPGAGKTTLALALHQQISRSSTGLAVHVPMDGFHLADRELTRLGRLDRKGAPDTFDAAGYRALLMRLRRAAGRERVYAPAFDREIEQPIAGSIPVEPGARLVITEGNYLLHGTDGWAGTAELLEETWWVDLPEQQRRARLEARHRAFGKGEHEAATWVREVDEANARLIGEDAERATIRVRGDIGFETPR